MILLIAAALTAIGDWVAVACRLRRTERLLKPAALALLVAVAATAELGPTRPLVVAALALGLVGDLALLFAPGGAGRAFLAGLAAFLAGHVLWIVVLVERGLHPLDLAAGALVTIGVGGLVAPALLRAVRRDVGPAFAGVVALYAAVLAAMTVLAVGTGIVLVAIGGVAFLVSDAVLARHRFVAAIPQGDLIVIVSYHLAQGLLLLGLIRSF